MRQEEHEKSINALRVQHAYDLESQERKYEALLSDLRRQLAAAQERSARYEHNSALHTNMLGAVIATLERELAEAREEATTLRRQLAEKDKEYRHVQQALVEVGTVAGADDPTWPESIMAAIDRLVSFAAVHGTEAQP